MIKELPIIKNKTGWPWTEETSPAIYDATIDLSKISFVTPTFNQNIKMNKLISRLYHKITLYLINWAGTTILRIDKTRCLNFLSLQ